MCGIAAIIADSSRSYEANLHRMVKALQHRGPDASGTFFFENCALGHARLSIVDLSTGDQPMVDGRSSVGITFNGEIYGYKSIKKS
jgi:asparagine synthase (glutamine-hydrolysing)